MIHKVVTNYFIFFVSIGILFTGCAPSIYMVSVIDRSPKIEPEWLAQQLNNEIVGLGEHRFKKTAYDEAIKDLQKRVASEIGIEIEFHSSNKKTESSEGYFETSELNLDIIGDAILQEIHTNISGTYWEHCRAQTGRKSFNDFYRYYVKANISSDLIDTLRSLTEIENDKRLEAFNTSLSAADAMLNANESNPMESIRNYVETLEIANSLFYGKNSNSRTCLNRLSDIIRDFTIRLITPYSEVRPTRHYLEFEVKYKNSVIESIPIGFHLSSGKGSINSRSSSNIDGTARCEVYHIRMNNYNQIAAYLEFSDLLDQLKRINSSSTIYGSKNLINLINGNACKSNFSSKSQKAIVYGGALSINNVKLELYGLYSRVKKLDCEFYLEEKNGRSAEFFKYDVIVKCWHKPFLSDIVSTYTRQGSFGISPSINVDYYQRKIVILPETYQIASLINELKSAHEIGMRKIQIEIKLSGTDDAENNLSVRMKSEAIPWSNLFEK